MTYQELVQSNWGFITIESQEKLKNNRVLLAGCGLGSNIAVLAARTGFTKFVLADGDSIELSNLNRQAFRVEHLGRNKAEVVGELIKEVNPQAEITVFSRFIETEEQVYSLVTKSDLAVDMIDPSPLMYQLNKIACSQGIPVLFPLNIGFGGAVLVFSSESASLEQILDQGIETKPEAFFLRLVEKLEPYLPRYLQGFVSIKDRVMQEGLSLPQLGIASHVTTALAVTALIKLTLGVSIKTAPYPLTLDCW
ncbi:ThiF family adenylyltransferase [Chloroflexota bacterium]